MVDRFEQEGIRAYGPSACAAVIESSKVFAKNLMKKYAIPTASYEVFDNPRDAVTYILDTNRFPVVIKADGLALGKGVIIAENAHEAKAAIASIMEDRIFGASGNRIVVEEFLSGPEVSVLAFTDGKVVVRDSSMDHKRAYDNTRAPIPVGMGTIGPNPHYNVQVQVTAWTTYFYRPYGQCKKKVARSMGCLYFGLMLTNDWTEVIEYNARFGDPEKQVVLLDCSHRLDIIEATLNETLETVPFNG
jgi:phosphoribosylamine--glycine ligase